MRELNAVLTRESLSSYPMRAIRRSGQRTISLLNVPACAFLRDAALRDWAGDCRPRLGSRSRIRSAKCFCICGDGGFAHVWSELETAKRLGIKVTVIVLNNQILGYQWHAEDVLYGDHTDACQSGPVDHAAIARACGCEGVRIEKPADFQASARTRAALEHHDGDRRDDRSQSVSADHVVRRQDGILMPTVDAGTQPSFRTAQRASDPESIVKGSKINMDPGSSLHWNASIQCPG